MSAIRHQCPFLTASYGLHARIGCAYHNELSPLRGIGTDGIPVSLEEER
ncbi:hypothetical protein [Lamprocystis purpurea]|nr:hypothetical protein [Lamprocystis purpurea]